MPSKPSIPGKNISVRYQDIFRLHIKVLKNAGFAGSAGHFF